MLKLNHVQCWLCAVVASAIALPVFAGPVEDGLAAGAKGDFAQARQLWSGAANAGDPTAALLLGDMYDHGRGVPVDRNEASKWYFKAAEKGDATAKARMAALTDELFSAMIGQPANNSKVDAKDGQTRFDREVAAIDAQYIAYQTCAVREARRLEVSGERADLVVIAAARSCDQGGSAPAVPGIMKEGARQDAMLAVLEARAKRASPPARKAQ